MFRWLSFILVEIYTISFAFYQLKNGRRTDFLAILLPVIIAAVLFLQYLT
jgi:hypothetical protein